MKRTFLDYTNPIPWLAERNVWRYYRETGDTPLEATVSTLLERSVFYSMFVGGSIMIYSDAIKPLLRNW